MPEPDLPFPPDRPVPATFKAALEAMQNKAVLSSERYQKQQWQAVRIGAHPDIVEFERVFVMRARKLLVPLFAHNMVRTREHQRRLFLDGVSKNDGSRPYPHRAFAVDVVHSVDAWNLSDMEWSCLGHIGKEVAASKGIAIEWGGDWKFYDPAHWELVGWRNGVVPEGGYPAVDHWAKGLFPLKGK